MVIDTIEVGVKFTMSKPNGIRWHIGAFFVRIGAAIMRAEVKIEADVK